LQLETAVLKRRGLKDPYSAISHGIGAVLAVAGLVFLIVESKGDPWRVTSFAIYGATLILLYTASALYHALKAPPHIEGHLYRFDRAAIFALIAGTYTPICLVILPSGWGWSLLGVIWSLAVGGIVLDVATRSRAPHWVQALLYLVMGWVFLVAIVPLLRSLTLPALVFLGLGIGIYSIGAAICVRHPHPVPGRFHFHDAWHVLVLAASACHFVLMAIIARG
jgi:hemolysin III